MASIVEELGDLEKLQKELEYLQTHAVKVGVLVQNTEKVEKYLKKYKYMHDVVNPALIK